MLFDQLHRCLVSRRGHRHDPKATLTNIMVETPTQIHKPLLVDVSKAKFHRECTDRLDKTKTGNIVAGYGVLDDLRHLLRALFRVIIFDQRTRIDEGIGHLEALITFCNNNVRHGPGNRGECPPYVL
jgi:hypothetical protein